MKKLMLAAAIVCAAVISQGASLSWKLTGGSTYKYNQVALIDAANIAAVQGILDVGGGDILSNLSSYELGGLKNASKGGAVADSTASVPDTDTGLSYAWVVLKTTDSGRTITDGTTGYIISGAVSYADLAAAGALVSGSATPVSFETASSMTAAGALTGTIGSGAVPEPTSAMLLLLGVAGLALKRKHA